MEKRLKSCADFKVTETIHMQGKNAVWHWPDFAWLLEWIFVASLQIRGLLRYGGESFGEILVGFLEIFVAPGQKGLVLGQERILAGQFLNLVLEMAKFLQEFLHVRPEEKSRNYTKSYRLSRPLKFINQIKAINQSIEQLPNQAINQLINQSNYPSIKQSIETINALETPTVITYRSPRWLDFCSLSKKSGCTERAECGCERSTISAGKGIL